MWLIDKIDSFLGVKKIVDPVGRKKMKDSYFCKDCYINEYWFEEVEWAGTNACPICNNFMAIKFKDIPESRKNLALIKHKEMWKQKFGKYPW